MSSLYKIAELAGVSVATVSRVVNDKGYVSKATRLKVEESIKALHYTLNQGAHSLKTSNTKLIGLFVPDVNNPVYLEQFKGVMDFFNEKGYNMIYSESGDSDEKIDNMVRRFLSNRVEGIILTSRDFSQFDNMDEIIEPAIKNNVPVVANGFIDSQYEIDKVSVDSANGAFLATDHLLKLGHTRIGLIAGSECRSTSERYDGYIRALFDHNVQFAKELVVNGDYRKQSGYTAMQKLLELKNPPTAVFAMNDVMAIGAMMALEDAKIKIPEQMAVVGFDDIMWCSLVRPQLTSVVQQKYETGRILAEMLYSRITKEYEGPGRHRTLVPRLAVRSSSYS